MAELKSLDYNWEELSDDEWNRRLDEEIAGYNKYRGELTRPPAPTAIMTNEYDRGILNKLVTEDLIRHYADAIGDPNPLWRDPTYAAGTHWGGIVAPPTFESAVAFSSSGGGKLRVPGVSGMNAGFGHKYFKPFRPGDTFAVYDKFMGIDEKEVHNKPYRMFVESVQRFYVNQREEVACISDSRRIYLATPPGKREKGKSAKMYTEKKKPFFDADKMAAIHQAYDDQLLGKNRRGAEVRYWEDVEVGEELPTVIKGPYDVCDACARTVVSCYPYAFAIKWAAMREHIQHHPVDPETGENLFLRDWHYTDHAAQIRGYPIANAAGAHIEMMLVHVVTDWMGDDGFVKSMDSQIRRMLFFGDMTYVKGTVEKKYVDEDGDHVVAISVKGVNQDGVTHTAADFVVKLVSHEAYADPV